MPHETHRTKDKQHSEVYNYTTYGYGENKVRSLTLLGFNGEQRHPARDGYLLGNGHRFYGTRVMRFFSPDLFSPFSSGGINAYVYAENDPVNYTDPTGNFRIFAKTKNFHGAAKFVNGVYAYMSKHPTQKGKQAITIDGHGNPGNVQTTFGNATPSQIYRGLASQGFDTGKYDIHILACNSASAAPHGGISVAQELSNLTGRNTIGYEGAVFGMTKFNKTRLGSGIMGVSTTVTEKQSSLFGRVKDFNFKRVTASPQRTTPLDDLYSKGQAVRSAILY